jgi:hypothetical protein
MQRDLSYQLPFERLTKLSRSVTRDVSPRARWSRYLRRCAGQTAGDGRSSHWRGVAILRSGPAIFPGIWSLRRPRLGQLEGCANFNRNIRLTQDDGSLRFVTDEVEHSIKWRGISQILVERDGAIASHGNQERLTFIRDVTAV